jgi:hypothetical protein
MYVLCLVQGQARYQRGGMAIPSHAFDFAEMLFRFGGWHLITAIIGEAAHRRTIRAAYQGIKHSKDEPTTRLNMTNWVELNNCYRDIHAGVRRPTPERRRGGRSHMGLARKFTVDPRPVLVSGVCVSSRPSSRHCCLCCYCVARMVVRVLSTHTPPSTHTHAQRICLGNTCARSCAQYGCQ